MMLPKVIFLKYLKKNLDSLLCFWCTRVFSYWILKIQAYISWIRKSSDCCKYAIFDYSHMVFHSPKNTSFHSCTFCGTGIHICTTFVQKPRQTMKQNFWNDQRNQTSSVNCKDEWHSWLLTVFAVLTVQFKTSTFFRYQVSGSE